MLVEIYDCVSGETLFTVNIPVSEIGRYVDLVKIHGVEDTVGDEYVYEDAKAYKDGFITYVQYAK
jgi:hypothetical protein